MAAARAGGYTVPEVDEWPSGHSARFSKGGDIVCGSVVFNALDELVEHYIDTEFPGGSYANAIDDGKGAEVAQKWREIANNIEQ